ncbi:YgiT-type zinc finger protein [Candidatus Microgenomates bacterium]|nr:YgiT-type zinc finger protein [Candidatus Microgenomates bacterium]
MRPFEHCPVCGGALVEKEVEELLHGGMHTAVLRVRTDVSLHCGERFYHQETVRDFARIRRKLTRQEIADFNRWGNPSWLPVEHIMEHAVRLR